LMLAVEANSPSLVKWLLERGADPKAALKTGWQAIHLALRLGHDSCVLLLLQEVRGGREGGDVVRGGRAARLGVGDLTGRRGW